MPLTPTTSTTCGFVPLADRPFGGGEDAQDLLLDEIAQALAPPRARADRLDDLVGGGDADVGHDQQLFERLERLDVNRARPLLRRVGALDQRLESFGELLRGARQALLQLVEKTHYCRLYRARARTSARFARGSLRAQGARRFAQAHQGLGRAASLAIALAPT